MLNILVPVAAVIYRIIAATYRIREINADKISPYKGKTERFIYAFCHAELLLHIYFYRGTKMASLASLSKDGEIAARAAEKFGITMVRGSSSRGGAGALMGLKALAEKGFDVALTIDGPRGPLGMVNSGVIYLAKLTGLKIVPCCFCCDRGIRLNTWDRFLIPIPFSKGVFNFGEPIEVPSSADEAQMAHVKERIKASLENLHAACGMELGGKNA